MVPAKPVPGAAWMLAATSFVPRSTTAVHPLARSLSSSTTPTPTAATTATPTPTAWSRLARLARSPRISVTCNSTNRAALASKKDLHSYQHAEHTLLSHLPTTLDWSVTRVAIPRQFWHSGSVLDRLATARARTGPEYAINTLVVRKRGSTEEKPPLVLLHGWAGALGMWINNLEALAEHHTVYALDHLGWGGSSRPAFAQLFPTCDPDDAALAGRAYFVEALHAWRTHAPFDNVAPEDPPLVMIGHSMGGYIAASYALAHPETLARTILLSPIGLQGFPAAPTNETDGVRARVTRAVVQGVWASTPQRVLSVLGETRSRALMSRARGRVARFYGDDRIAHDMVEYLWRGVRRAPGIAGERAFAALGSPAIAGWRLALHDQLLAAATVPGAPMYGKLAVAYGLRDWIDPSYAIRELAPRGVPVYLLPNAGHHGYVEDAERFARVVVARGAQVPEARSGVGKELADDLVRERQGGWSVA
ncbi:Alpha/Beta hydrolase protein [Blastocladiella britannica]|nr:Alpha/Beta hydrolase protein [Blastocladiella britannica]